MPTNFDLRFAPIAVALLLSSGASAADVAKTTLTTLRSLDPADLATWSASLSESGLLKSFGEAAERRATASASAGNRGRGQGRRNARDENGIPENASELRGCGEVIGLHARAEIQGVGDALVMGALPPEFAPVATPIIQGAIKYDVRSRKICSSCKEMMELFGEEMDLMGTAGTPDGFLSYCGEGIEGHDAVFSGLLLEPIEEGTGLPPLGKVKATVWTKGTETHQFRVPSERWPSSLSVVTSSMSTEEEILETLGEYLDLVGPLMAATSGTYALMADGKGYGEDWEGNPGYLVKRAYQSSFVPLWLHAKNFVASSTNGCTIIDDKVSLGGYSAGGYEAIADAKALSTLGVEIIRVSAGGAPFRMSSAVPMGTLELVDSGTFPEYASGLAAIFGYAYSSTDPHLPNTGTGQDLLATEWMDESNEDKNVLGWIEDGMLGIFDLPAKMPDNPLDIYNQGILSFFRNANNNPEITDPCVTEVETGVNDKICEALIENDLTDLLEATTFPVQLCHSPDDNIVSVKNLPDVSSNELLTEIQFPTPTGSHFEANLVCALGALIPFTTFGGDPAVLAGIDPPDDDGCLVPGANTLPPVTVPTSSPTPAPQQTETPAPTPSPEDNIAQSSMSAAKTISGGFGAATAVFAVLASFW